MSCKPGLERVDLSGCIGEIPHLLHNGLRLLRDHRQSVGRGSAHPRRAIAEKLESHASEKLAAMLELRLVIGSPLDQVGDHATLPLEVGKTPHPLFTRAVIERIRLRLETADL